MRASIKQQKDNLRDLHRHKSSPQVSDSINQSKTRIFDMQGQLELMQQQRANIKVEGKNLRNNSARGPDSKMTKQQITILSRQYNNQLKEYQTLINNLEKAKAELAMSMTPDSNIEDQRIIVKNLEEEFRDAQSTSP